MWRCGGFETDAAMGEGRRIDASMHPSPMMPQSGGRGPAWQFLRQRDLHDPFCGRNSRKLGHSLSMINTQGSPVLHAWRGAIVGWVHDSAVTSHESFRNAPQGLDKAPHRLPNASSDVPAKINQAIWNLQ